MDRRADPIAALSLSICINFVGPAYTLSRRTALASCVGTNLTKSGVVT